MPKTIKNYLVTITCQFMVGADSIEDSKKETDKVMEKLLLDPRVLGGPNGVTYQVDEVECLDVDEATCDTAETEGPFIPQPVEGTLKDEDWTSNIYR